jgi:hypothetical protein
MLEKKLIIENLQRFYCHKCGASLEHASLVPVNEASASLVAHAVCPSCKAESMVTITPMGSGIMPVQSDLVGSEFKKFITARAVNYDELLEIHEALKIENIWNLLDKKEKNLESQ